MRDPYFSIVRLSQGDALGVTMNKIRVWLDAQKIRPAEFRTSADAKGYTFTLGFHTIEEATQFRAQFGA